MNYFRKFVLLFCSTCFLPVSKTGQASVDKVQWISKENARFAALAPAGLEGTAVFNVGRGLHMSKLIPGKHHGSIMYVYFNGTEITTPTYYELLVAPEGSLSWVAGFRRNIPAREKFIFGGIDPITSEKQYIYRGWVDAVLVPGRYSYDEGVCLIPYCGAHKVDSFEILVLNSYGEAIKAGRGTFGTNGVAEQ